MKKTFAVIIALIIIIIASFTAWYLSIKEMNQEITDFNSEFESYADTSIRGVDLTTVINRAIDNNEKYSIEKDEDGAYINDEEYYIEIYVNIVENETEDEESEETESTEEESYAYPMEAFESAGMSDFTSLYGESYFECVDIEYHSNGRISKMIFEIV